ncbi:MAG: glycosyltransferase [Methanomassiliicoccales archaeon]|nr:glycosyltransferase [Methanomassiliicoccales archaeon]
MSIGICAYNEGRNIGSCLESILSQRLQGLTLLEAVVVSSGSTDDTDVVVRSFEERDARVRLVREERREGKNSAINLFLTLAKGDVLVLVNADNRLEEGSLQALLEPLLDEEVGVVGGHPVPIDPRDSLAGVATHMLWEMHHRVALIYPKVGELMAFRPLGRSLPTSTQSDEDLIRMDLERRGMTTVYAPKAIVRNKGPGTVRDFVRQRTRVNIGEKYMKRLHGYDIPTWNSRYLFQAYLSYLRDTPDPLPLVLGAMLLEAYSRLYATVYVALDKGDKAVWQQVSSTKDLGSR